MAYTDIDKPTDYFNTKLYTGNGSTNAITGVGFQPDWVWIKNRPDARDHQIYDSVRGTTKVIGSDRTSAEATVSNGLTAFGSDGFTVGADSNVNDNGDSHVSWNWLASNTTASNTDGSITSTVSANTTSGFSIVSWTGTGSNATIGHGLGASPELSFIKQRTGTQDWSTQATSLGYSKYLILNGNNAAANTSGALISSVSSTTISVDGNGYVNGSSNTYVGYFFSSIKGYSKIGSYVGNGSSDGSYIHLGFKASFFMLKNTASGTNWFMLDNKRDTSNVVANFLAADQTSAESSTDLLDITSNGIKQRNNYPNLNASGNTYIYMAFAENPFVTSTGIPTTAR